MLTPPFIEPQDVRFCFAVGGSRTGEPDAPRAPPTCILATTLFEKAARRRLVGAGGILEAFATAEVGG